MRKSTAVLTAATLALGGAIGYGVAVATQPAPTAHVVPAEPSPAYNDCAASLTEWGQLAMANADMLASVWEQGTPYHPDIRDRNTDTLAYQLDAILVSCAEALPACETEDSDGCYWNADIQGNGRGTSFIARDGETFPVGG